MPLSFFEKAGHAHYNSLVMIDATGELLGLGTAVDIPDGPGQHGEAYFTPGDTGFKAFRTASGRRGGICWDQWYPEAARAMALQGAEVMLYPTAIGSEPEAADQMDTSRMWQRVMIGHAVANACYLAAANRVGTEHIEGLEQSFYGCSFIADYTGEKIAEAGRTEETVLVAPLDLAAARSFRAGMGFSDRRPDLYAPLASDGRTKRRRRDFSRAIRGRMGSALLHFSVCTSSSGAVSPGLTNPQVPVVLTIAVPEGPPSHQLIVVPRPISLRPGPDPVGRRRREAAVKMNGRARQLAQAVLISNVPASLIACPGSDPRSARLRADADHGAARRHFQFALMTTVRSPGSNSHEFVPARETPAA